MSDSNVTFTDEQRRQLNDQLKRAREDLDDLQRCGRARIEELDDIHRRGRARIEELEKSIEGLTAEQKYKKALELAVAEVDGTPEFNAWKRTIKGVRVFFSPADIERFGNVEDCPIFTAPPRADHCTGLAQYYHAQRTIIHFELSENFSVNLAYTRSSSSVSEYARFADTCVYLRLDHPSQPTWSLDRCEPNLFMQDISRRVPGVDTMVKIHAWMANVYDLIFAVYKHAGTPVQTVAWRRLMRLSR